MVGCRRPCARTLRLQRRGTLRARETVRARRQFLSRGIRRLVPQPPVLDLRLCARVSACRYGTREAWNRHSRSRRERKVFAETEDGGNARKDGARGGADVRKDRRYRAVRLLRRGKILCRKHLAPPLPAEPQSPFRRRRELCVRGSSESD